MESFDDVFRWLCDDDDQQMESEIPTDKSTENSPTLSITSSESFDSEAMEMESKTGIQNLLMAYAEAMGLQQRKLAEVIQKCISEKVNPNGQTLERLALNLFPCSENEKEYLKQESIRNFKAAFRGFYEIFPYGRFAHFTANSAILEAVPNHVDSVHIVDFDMGEGSQWPVVIQVMAQRRKSLTITSVKLEDDNSGLFEETKMHLLNYAGSFGLNLKVEEKELGQIVNRNEFMAFNCMVGIPHMGRTRRRTQVMEFLKVAKQLLVKTQGIITFGDGEYSDRMENYPTYPSFFDGNLSHYKALYESMELGFPSYLTEGRVAMETLFIAPFISSMSWLQKWEEGRENLFSQNDLGLKGRRVSMESWNEVRELVKEGESMYKVRVEGGNENEMVLEWNGIPLVRVSVWM
ncbi:protein NODULATION SIGNALING PATHWAY 2 [Lactuca sativa]|nr:protein NODULATION SIGNALING PATHWAY 2 [Lactuca sativa]